MRSSDEKLFSGLIHLSIFLQGLGIFVALIVYMIQKNKSYFVTRHAIQSLIYQAAIYVLSFVLGIFGVAGFSFGAFNHMFDSRIGLFSIVPIIGLILFVLAVVIPIFASIQGFQGKNFTYPIIGKYADRLM